MNDAARLRIAVQKSGRLASPSLELLERAGIRFTKSKDQLFCQSKNFAADLLMLRDDDIPELVNEGACDLGLVGLNVFQEKVYEYDRRGRPLAIERIADLGFGTCRLSLAVPKGGQLAGRADLDGRKIATSYPETVQHWLDNHAIKATVVEMSGAIEIAPRLQIADAICDLVSTGGTLAANGLQEVETISESQSILIRRTGDMPPAKEALIERLMRRIAGVQKAGESKYIMLHAPVAALDKIRAALPGVESPTILPLQGRNRPCCRTHGLRRKRLLGDDGRVEGGGGQRDPRPADRKDAGLMKKLVWKDLGETERAAAMRRPAAAVSSAALESVRDILRDVNEKGADAVRALTRRFDGYDPDPFFVDKMEIENAGERLAAPLRHAMQLAYANIRRFHRQQGYRPYTIEVLPGLTCARQVVPVQHVGLYIPGGTAPLLSTALMLGVPSQLAENPERILCTPAGRDGAVPATILFAAHLCGIDRIVRVGGAQAIAGLAYGVFGAPADKIFGPGNAYVTLAKQMAAQETGGPAIDMPAGPSEVLVIVDEETPDAFAAADLLAQAEHDAASQVVLIAPSERKADGILAAVAARLGDLPRAEIARAALESSLAIVAASPEEAIDISNRYAPEHLILAVAEFDFLKSRVVNAGSIFCGLSTPESLGDYASGTNHVLPTAAAARAYSGLGVEAFQKTITCQIASVAALEEIGPAVEIMAKAEGLEAHARAVGCRTEKGRNDKFLSFITGTLVPASRGILLAAFARLGTDDLNVAAKEDGSPASDADRDAERALRDLIQQRYPDHGIIGEEFGADKSDAEYVWVLDPLDGTKEFLAREKGWGTLIALLHRGRPVAGVIDEPLRGIVHSGGVNQVESGGSGFPDITVSCTAPASMFSGGVYEKKVERLFAAVKEVTPRLNCIGFTRVAAGEIDIAVEDKNKLHDIAALLPVLWRSGAVCRTLEGTDYAEWKFDLSDLGRNYSIVAGPAEAVRQALAFLEG